jgi:hypothetical protein
MWCWLYDRLYWKVAKLLRVCGFFRISRQEFHPIFAYAKILHASLPVIRNHKTLAWSKGKKKEEIKEKDILISPHIPSRLLQSLFAI